MNHIRLIAVALGDVKWAASPEVRDRCKQLEWKAQHVEAMEAAVREAAAVHCPLAVELLPHLTREVA